MTEPLETTPSGPSGPSGPRAGFWARFAALLVDSLVLFAVYIAAYLILGDSLAALLSIALPFAYYGYFEGSASGQTLGKRALSIRVIDFNTGGPIGFGRGLLRYLGKIISGIPFALGYLWMLWDREKQTWHDKIATTVVVPTSAYPVS
jgi:uncharacterized RDD family membrane protein YckC